VLEISAIWRKPKSTKSRQQRVYRACDRW